MVPYDPPPPRPAEPNPPGVRSILVHLLLALALIFGAILLVPSPAYAHGGDGRSAPCATPNAVDISPTKCGNAFIVGNIVYANVTDKLNDGHCVRVEARHNASSSWFYVGQACPLGVNVHIARVMHTASQPWNQVRIRDHRYVTLCGRGSGRTC